MEDQTKSRDNIRGWIVPFFAIGILIAAAVMVASSPPEATTQTSRNSPVMAVVATEAPAAESPAEAAADAIPAKIIFNRDIRPILADRCFYCHGPDPNKRQAGLRLDRLGPATGPLPKHPNLRAFIPGDPDHSEALRRILSTDPTTIMPPPSAHRELDAHEKEMIRQWLIQGGAYQEHWGFVRPVRSPLPAVKDKSWPKNDIDYFVLANLESHGMEPSPQADKATLIRRVSLDLTGIPPTPKQVDAFIADPSPNAYEKVVDRLLASPEYGEQMAVQWLDYARYADSHGFQSDPERHMWRWRDWVINAYNSNMPFDQFTIKQLAGDLLPNATINDKIATGFNRNHRINDEGGIIAEEWRVEGVLDRATTTGSVFLGLTVGCCRCHDHKFDPITQKEFYSFTAYFNSVNEVGIGDTGTVDKGINVAPVLKIATPEQTKQLKSMADQIIELTAKAAELKKSIPVRVASLEKSGASFPEPAGRIASFSLNGDIEGDDANNQPIVAKFIGKRQPDFAAGRSGKALRFNGDSSAVDADDAVKFERTDHFSYGAWINRRGSGAILSRMDSADSYRGFDLFVDSDHLAVHIIHHWDDNAIKVRTVAVLPKNKWVHVFATYDGSGKATGLRIYFDGQSMPLTVEKDALTGTITTKSHFLIGKRDGSDPFMGDISDVRVYNRTLSPPEVAGIARGDEVRRILALSPAKRTPGDKQMLTAFVADSDPEISSVDNELNRVRIERSALDKSLPDTMIMEDLPKPRPTYVLLRGEYDQHGERVEPGVPAVLSPLPKGAPPNRLGLAEWIVDPANPLTSRVQVNRFWEKFFGVGLVKTSENLGTQADWPSNPELLDWLATEFIRVHWDMKAFQKELVMSAAYQQSSDVTPEMVENDPEDRLIERGPRFRLTAEEIRDQALAASGLLVEKIGGPSVRPYEPADLWAGNLFGNLDKYVPDKGENLYRRTIYTFIKRTAVPANLALFDQPTREYCVIRRSRTDTPLQALDLMNDPTYVEASRVLAEKMMTEGGQDPAAKIRFAFQRVTCRMPTNAELAILLDGYQKHLQHFQNDRAAAASLVKVGDSPVNPKLDVIQLAAYTMTSSVILNLDETVTRE